MKFLFLTLLLSLPVLAKSDLQNGLFQVDSSTSSVTMFDKDQRTFGHIDIRQNFRDSIIKLESSDTSFESMEIKGEPEDFLLKGIFTYKGSKRLIELKGRIYSFTDKIGIKLHNELIMLRLAADRPLKATYELQKQVERIIE